ncbi:MAG: hypothetical protein Q8R78_00955 [Candidatus Omnitrophota bacterium]|nr:hypothetical protein [Candidatus Omnitrophota bacterium]
MAFQSYAEIETARDAFLTRIAEHYRGMACNLFLAPVREDGLWRADLVLMATVRAVRSRTLRAASPASQAEDNLRALWQAIQDDAEGALATAEWAVAYVLLPAGMKEARKAAQQEKGRHYSMQGKPPTEKQVAYLRRQGYTGAIEDRLHASQLIDAMMAEQKEARG